jgi:hypothetical protein
MTYVDIYIKREPEELHGMGEVSAHDTSPVQLL